MENFDKIIALFLELFDEISNNSKAREAISSSVKNIDKLAYYKKYENKPLFIKELLSNFSDMNYDISQFIKAILTANKILGKKDRQEELGLIGIGIAKEIVAKDDSSGLFFKHYIMASIYFLINYTKECSQNIEIMNDILNEDLGQESKEALFMYWFICSIYEESLDYKSALEYLNISKNIELKKNYELIEKNMFLEKEYYFCKKLGKLDKAMNLSLELFRLKEKKELIDFERVVVLASDFGKYSIAIEYLEKLLELEDISAKTRALNYKKLTNLYVNRESYKRSLDRQYMR